MNKLTLPGWTARCGVVVPVAAILWLSSGLAMAEVAFKALWQEEASCIEEYPVQALLTWRVDLAGVEAVEVRVDTPDGGLLASDGPSGSAETGDWVGESTAFFLVSRPAGQVLGEAMLETPSCHSLRLAERRQRLMDLLEQSPEGLLSFELSPPRLFYCGRPVERTAVRLEWDVSALEATRVEVFLRSPDGQPFSAGDAVGQAETRDWVTDGTVFVLYLPEFEQVVATREFRIRPCAEASQ